MIPTVFLGVLALVVAVVPAALWRRLPPRAVCPSCGEATEGVVLAAPLRFLQHLLRRRWCPACRWTGFGRNGPVLSARRGPVAHDSGFQWNALDLPPDMGFQWGSAENDVPGPAPIHPPGFLWGGGPDDRSPRPGGFRWGGERGGGSTGESAPHAFGSRRSGEAEKHEDSAAPPHPSGFRWARADLPASRPPVGQPAPGFRWADEGAAPGGVGHGESDAEARRLLRLRHAERVVGFRWGGRDGGDGPEAGGPSPGH